MKEPITFSEQNKVMAPAKRMLSYSFSNLLICTFSALFLTLGFWIFFAYLQFSGYPLPVINISKFFDLGFFSFSFFSFIVFLTMIPFQASEGKLSPGFYARLIRTPQAHFGLYVLILSSMICFIVLAISENNYLTKETCNSLFMAIIASIIFAIVFHRIWVLRSIYQPYVVYKNITKLSQEETREKVWLELLECTYKAIAGRHINYATNFLQLMYLIYQRHGEHAEIFFGEDLRSLYKATTDFRPVARAMETKWPSLKSSQSSSVMTSEVVPERLSTSLSLKKAKVAKVASSSILKCTVP